MKKQPTKIPVHHYTEVDDTMALGDTEIDDRRYIANEGGKVYLVEVWA